MRSESVDFPMRRIFLADCDQFFVQCARLADPDGAGREPLLLVGGSVAGRGVVTSASYETRAFGVRSGMPTARALRLCPHAVVVPVPRALCVEKGRAVRRVLERFAPVVEPASIDEAYLDLSGTDRLYGHEPLTETARKIRAAVLADTAIRVSVGGGTSKLVAKLAVARAKPDGVYIVPGGEEAGFLGEHDLSDIPGVGPVMTRELARYGLERVSDALALESSQLDAVLGERRSAWLRPRLRGIDHAPVRARRPTKSISRDETFPDDVDDDGILTRALRRLVRRLGTDLRREGLRARTVTVRIRDADFRTRQAARTVERPVESDRALYALARPLLERLRSDRRAPARLLGVAAAKLETTAGAQLALFESETTIETERDRAVAHLTDRLRARFGLDAIGPADLLDE